MCNLCELEKKTHWYYEDDLITVLDCLTCKIPMVVFHRHITSDELTKEEVDRAKTVCDDLFGDYDFRKKPRKIKDHVHWHVKGNKK